MPDFLAPGSILLPGGAPYVPVRDIQALLTIKTIRAERKSFILNRVQRDLIQTQGHRDLTLKSRRIGVTSVKCADFCLRTLLRGNIAYALVLDEESKVAGWRQIIDDWVKEDLRKWGISPRIGKDNANMLTFPGIGSEIHVFTAGKKAPGRSSGFNILHLSETSHYEDAEKTITAIEPTVPPPPYGIISEESTPYGVGGLFYDDWQAARAAETDSRSSASLYLPHFYPWWWDDTCRIAPPPWFSEPSILAQDEQKLQIEQGLDYEQLWWRRTTKERLERAGDSFLQEYPEDDESCFIGSGSKVFDREGLRYLHTLIRPPFKILWDGALYIWTEAEVGHQYVVGADTSEGGLGDFHAAVVLDKETKEHVATLRPKENVTPNVFAQLLDDLGRMYRHRGHQAYLGVERRSTGLSVLSKLDELGYDNLHSEIARVEQRRPVYEPGVMVSGATKPKLVNDLQEAVRTVGITTHDRDVIMEMSNYVGAREGGVLKTHAAGRGHDDLVSAMMIAVRMLDEAPLPRDERAGAPIDLLGRRTG